MSLTFDLPCYNRNCDVPNPIVPAKFCGDMISDIPNAAMTSYNDGNIFCQQIPGQEWLAVNRPGDDIGRCYLGNNRGGTDDQCGSGTWPASRCNCNTSNALACKRALYRGNPIQCCLMNVQCSTDNCFIGPELNPGEWTQTCPPEYLKIRAPACMDILFGYFTGADLPEGSLAWMDRWMTVRPARTDSPDMSDGQYAIMNILFVNPNPGNTDCTIPPTITKGVCNIDPRLADNVYSYDGYNWCMSLLQEVLLKYRAAGFVLGSLPSQQGYNVFQDYLYINVCCPFPFLCQIGLSQSCSMETIDSISRNPSKASWCGCYLPDEAYDKYTNLFRVNKECTPMCNRQGVIPLVTVGAEPIVCAQGVCIIDDVTINIIDSQIRGGIQFTQICANCGNGGCSCIVDGENIDINGTIINGSLVPVTQGCVSTSCTQTNPEGAVIGPDNITNNCKGKINPYGDYQARAAKQEDKDEAKTNLWTWIIVTVIILIVLALVMFYLRVGQ